jgi:hypothetical protein
LEVYDSREEEKFRRSELAFAGALDFGDEDEGNSATMRLLLLATPTWGRAVATESREPETFGGRIPLDLTSDWATTILSIRH